MPEPIATSGTDRNFYDRFFNGYTPDGRVFFAAALGVYPHLNVMDASFSLIVDGVQRNLHASRVLNMERMDTRVGPISIEVIEPLATACLVDDNEHGIKADLMFTMRAPAVEEPRFNFRQGPRTFMDYTRLTQNGSYDGFIEVKGKRIAVLPKQYVGTRPLLGCSAHRPFRSAASRAPRPPQFYWLWAPLNFEDRFMLYHNNAEASGKPWNTASVMGKLGDEEPLHMVSCHSLLEFKSGTPCQPRGDRNHR